MARPVPRALGPHPTSFALDFVLFLSFSFEVHLVRLVLYLRATSRSVLQPVSLTLRTSLFNTTNPHARTSNPVSLAMASSSSELPTLGDLPAGLVWAPDEPEFASRVAQSWARDPETWSKYFIDVTTKFFRVRNQAMEVLAEQAAAQTYIGTVTGENETLHTRVVAAESRAEAEKTM